MKTYTSIIFTIILVASTACSSIGTKDEYTHQFDFTEIMTYKTSKEQGSQYFDEIKEAINLTMAHKGLGINTKHYDFTIDWNLEPNGALNIEVYDPKNMDIVWRGWTTEPISRNSIKTAVQNIFEDFPPSTAAVFQ